MKRLEYLERKLITAYAIQRLQYSLRKEFLRRLFKGSLDTGQRQVSGRMNVWVWSRSRLHSFRIKAMFWRTNGRGTFISNKCAKPPRADIHAELCGECISQWECTKHHSPIAKCYLPIRWLWKLKSWLWHTLCKWSTLVWEDRQVHTLVAQCIFVMLVTHFAHWDDSVIMICHYCWFLCPWSWEFEIW